MHRFKVVIDQYASSPLPQQAVWNGQHFCVSENPEFDEKPNLTEAECGEAVIRHQLRVEHYSVLDMAFVKFDCYHFPHSVVAQITRHSDSHFLVQSNRYTGDRFVKVAKEEIPIESVFYLRPAERFYYDRTGHKYYYSEESRRQDLALISNACTHYAVRVVQGMPYEMARSFLPYDFRQDFTMSCTYRDLFHWLDQRTKKDSQLEIQHLATLVLAQLELQAPEFYNWYMKSRFGNARLAP